MDDWIIRGWILFHFKLVMMLFQQYQTQELGNQNVEKAKKDIQWRILKCFFQLRQDTRYNIHELSQILSQTYSMKLPKTPYREFPARQVFGSRNQRHIRGIYEYVNDVKSLKMMKEGKSCQQLSYQLNGYSSERQMHMQLEISYFLEEKDFIFNGRNKVMGCWIKEIRSKSIPNLSIKLKGMLSCEFNDVYRISNMELIFDVNATMLFLQTLKHYEDRLSSGDTMFLWSVPDGSFLRQKVIPSNKKYLDLKDVPQEVLLGNKQSPKLYHILESMNDVKSQVSIEDISWTCSDDHSYEQEDFQHSKLSHGVEKEEKEAYHFSESSAEYTELEHLDDDTMNVARKKRSVGLSRTMQKQKQRESYRHTSFLHW
mmetsp:Transcript_308/g.416  ORF Transcript_308/g.416 Transcript_308/m.416 type:complete len:370 (+) Transcript_308:37-1146(+)